MRKIVCIVFLLPAILFGMAACAASRETPDPVSGLDFTELVGLEFWFGSGVGAWSTVVEIFPDGTFTGYYHDSDAGDNGPDYPDGTMYECCFSGEFSAFKKVDEYTYSTRCVSLKTEGTAGEEKILDGIKVITADPYGFDDADEFMLYLPGKRASELPAGFLDWSHGSASSGALDCHGLYNVAGQQGFTSYRNSPLT